MFPRPIEQVSGPARFSYKLALPVALVIWLLPLLGVALTSLRPAADLAAGNYFGLPSAIAFSNYADVFNNSPIGQYIFNSFKVTIPTVIGTVAIATMKGFALGIWEIGERFGIDVARAERVDGDAGSSGFLGQTLGEADDAGFGGGVVGLAARS